MQQKNSNGQIPPELHDIIIPHLKDERGLLLAYGAVCRSWDNAAWPYRRPLFQRIYLTGENIISFMTLLHVSSRILPCIQVVSAKFPLRVGQSIKLSCLGVLLHINVLRLHELPVTLSLISSISGLAARIRELEIGTLGAEDPSHLAQFVRLFTNLQRLCIKGRPKLLLPCTSRNVRPAGQTQLDTLKTGAHEGLPLESLLDGISHTTETIRFGEQAICRYIKCVCLDDDAHELWMAGKIMPVPHAQHLSHSPNLRHIEFDLTLEGGGWSYDITKLLSDGLIQNPNIEALRIRWDVTKHDSDLFRAFALDSVLLLESVCQALSARATQFCKLQSITFEAFEGTKIERTWLPLVEAHRDSFDWLVKYLRNRLPISDDDTVQCYSVRSLDMSKVEIEVGVRVVPSESS